VYNQDSCEPHVSGGAARGLLPVFPLARRFSPRDMGFFHGCGIMPSSPPWFPFYPDAFTSDEVVEAMNTLEVGAYILLLCKAWKSDPPGSLPDDDTVLARYARLDPQVWSAAKPRVMAAFNLGKDSRWHQKRLRNEYALASQRIRSLSERGKKGASKRWKTPSIDASAIAEAMAEACNGQCSSNAQAMLGICSSSFSSLSEEENKEEGGRGEGGGGDASAMPQPSDTDSFSVFWSAYPRKTNKEDARKAWKKLRAPPELLAVILAALEAHGRTEQWQKGIIPHPSTWLNKRRWEDEVSPPCSAVPGTVSDQGKEKLRRLIDQDRERDEQLAREREEVQRNGHTDPF